MNARLDAAMAHWSYVAPLLTPPKNQTEYDALVESLDAILDAGGADETHPLGKLAVMVGDLVSAYEAQHSPMPEAATPAMMLAYLMEQHRLKQADLPELGGQSVVSDILRGKRTINLRQAKALAARFGVALEVFV
jgi:HTH-type transcriptional regulator / antitoxin HigA